MKVERFLATVILAVFFMAGNCFAMKFSQPIEIGRIFHTPSSGIIIRKADAISGNSNRTFQDEKTYDKFTARWGDEVNGIYCHWDKYPPNFGGRNEFFPVQMMVDASIQQIKNNENMPLYMVVITGSDIRNIIFYLIGKQQDGKWVKYFDTQTIKQNYPLTRMGYLNEKFSVRDDTIIIAYGQIQNMNQTSIGEFRFKWDEAAQWFSVEQVKYSESQVAASQAQSYVAQGENLYKSGKHREALEKYNQAINLNPNLADAYISRSVVLYVDSRTIGTPADQVKAMNDINRALELNPNSARAYRWRAYMNKWKTPSSALADINRAIKLDTQYLDAYETRAQIYEEMKKYSLAIADYTFILENPNFKNSYMQHYDFDMMGDWEWYSDWEQRTAALYNKRGTAYYNNGERDNAIDDFERALKLSPNNMWIGRVFQGNVQQEIANKKKRSY